MTGILAPKTPGGTLMLPPGFKLVCHNPKLSPITNQDEDIKEMISAGLNVPKDVMTGSSSGTTYGGAKLSRGPVSDRTSDQQVDLERWLIHSFWRGVLWLNSKVTGTPWIVKEERAYKFENGQPKFKKVDVPLHRTIEIGFPQSAMDDLDNRTKALLGVKHGPLTKTLGVSNASVSRKLGFSQPTKERLLLATEEKQFPELMTNEEVESTQERQQEPGLETPKPTNTVDKNEEDDV